jgi:hypothetical protein
MGILATVIDTEALRDVVIAGFVAGIGITATFGIVIYGSTKSVDLRREGNRVGSVFFGVVAAIGFAAFAASVVYGLIVMADK